MIITLRRAAICRECGATLPAGVRANWYKNGAVYGLTCHSKSAGRTSARVDSNEDYPCSDRGYEDQCAAACGLNPFDRGSW